MKITLNWLKQYVDFNWSANELAERLTMLGVEVEAIQKLGSEFEGIVVAAVVTVDKHPNADKLTLCRVNDGKTERQIVCGAHNFKAGDKVPLIFPGASLPAKPGQEPFAIRVGKIRGVESQGMMCSPQELGLPDQIEGLLILREDAKVGQPFGEYLGRPASDVVLDLEITPNRPDLNSIIGIAREISAVSGNPLKIPQVPAPQENLEQKVTSLVSVRLDDSELCPRYTARIVRGVRIGPSPDWLRTTLEKLGVRSINNVVDVTNYVMLESGQPLHAFDYHLLSARTPAATPTIVVRRAGEGEKFTTLDGQQRNLTREMLLIADETKAVALAGIMGGQNSEISAATTDVLIESADFKPQNIRATSKKLELRTESSYRFERGGDIGICDWASRRAVQLILETAGGRVLQGVVDAYPHTAEQKQITLRPHKVTELLGINLRADQIDAYLSQLELKPATRKPQPVGKELSPADQEPRSYRIPTFRVDLKREIDLIEEVGRLYGVDRIPATPPRGAIGANAYDKRHDELAEVRRIMCGLGLNETQGQTLISDAAGKLSEASLVALANPLSSDMNVLRPSLVPGLLDALRHNLNHRNNDMALFELGRTFRPQDPGAPAAKGVTGICAEERRLAIALTGERNSLFWTGEERGAKYDIFDLKGILEEFFDHIGLRGVTFVARKAPTTLFVESATVHLGKLQLGEIGQLQPSLAKTYDLRDAALLAELNLDVVLYRRNPEKSFRALPPYPSIRRDVAMIVPEEVTHEAVLQVVKQAKAANLEAVELFDVFRGKNVPPGQKSMAYAFTYRSAQRTLTDAEVNAAQEQIVSHLRSGLKAAIRDS